MDLTERSVEAINVIYYPEQRERLVTAADIHSGLQIERYYTYYKHELSQRAR